MPSLYGLLGLVLVFALINLEIADPYVAERMEEIFLTDQSNTVQLNEERWARRSWVAKLTELFLSPLRPLF